MSTVAVPAPTLSSPPRPLLWTVGDFHRIAETGVFEGRRPILLRGVLLEQGPTNSPHALAIELVMETLQATFGTGWRTRVQLPLVLGQETDPMPDIAMVVGSARGATDHPTTAALVVEVSDTTLALDLTEKADLYATAGIMDYWVPDVSSRRLLVFRDPAPIAAGGAAYRTHLTLGPTDSVSPLAAPQSTVAVADLLP